MPRLTLAVLASAYLLGCAGAAKPTPEPDPTPPLPVTAAASSAPEPAVTVSDPGACGELGCRTFDKVDAAIGVVLAAKPAVLGIGEAHAQKGSEHLPSTTKRFTEQILPTVAGRTSFLAVELLLPNPKCQKVTKQVAKQQKPVTEPQAETNQNEYVLLGKRAKELGIVPDLLRPSCEDLTRITQAGAGDIGVMLETIAKLTREVAVAEVDRNKKAGKDQMVIAYGGALHNDVEPRAGREAWTYGPDLAKATGDRYVELDLIVPEYIKDTETWTSLPWVKHYVGSKLGDKVVLYQPTPRSFVLVFPKTPGQ